MLFTTADQKGTVGVVIVPKYMNYLQIYKLAVLYTGGSPEHVDRDAMFFDVSKVERLVPVRNQERETVTVCHPQQTT